MYATGRSCSGLAVKLQSEQYMICKREWKREREREKQANRNKMLGGRTWRGWMVIYEDGVNNAGQIGSEAWKRAMLRITEDRPPSNKLPLPWFSCPVTQSAESEEARQAVLCAVLNSCLRAGCNGGCRKCGISVRVLNCVFQC